MSTSASRLPEIERLPDRLKERCRILNAKPVRADAELVLYWMHHAVRGHENPALEAAIALGEDLDLPVLVYQGLGGNHPCNNDRHHSFILQGARDAHRELRERGIRAVFHLDRQGDQPSPLRQLMNRAAALIVEDFPAPPFEPVDLETADFAELCAQSAIDHGIPPVAHTRGGSEAGYARWQRFRVAGLSGYANKRNDAAVQWPQGVSRLSAYLHHGHVSPFRIAREAWETGGAGAEKFLDELLIWRELAYNFCCFTKDPEHIDALPDWARDTLQEHASDPRPAILDPEALARSRTGDAVRDLAQTSLRVHGELHNNLRMTWAKAIIPWRPDPQAALDTLIELNHRYALDGSDPNSYGGLLWALMLAFDTDPPLPYDGLFFAGEEISWAARNSSKPGRTGNSWVVHAGPAWTRDRIDVPGDQIGAELSKLFAKQTGIDTASVIAQSAHRWLYSLVDNSLDVGALWDPELGLGLCGDWCHGARIEGAFLSGQAVAGRLLGHLANVNGSRL